MRQAVCKLHRFSIFGGNERMFSSIGAGRYRLVGLGVALAAGVLASTAQAQIALQAPPIDDVEIDIVNPRTGVAARIDRLSLRLTTRTVLLESDVRIDSLLASANIFPDGEAFIAIYRLNPLLEGATARAGTRLFLPVVTGPDNLSQLFTNGYSTYLTFDLKTKRGIVTRARELKALGDSAAMLPIVGAAGDSLRAQIVIIRRFADAVTLSLQARTRPIDTDLISSISAELDRAAEVLSRSVSEKKLTSDDTELIAVLAEQAQARLQTDYWSEAPAPPPGGGGRGGGGRGGAGSRGRSTRYPAAPITIRVLTKDGPGTDVNGLRVFFVAAGLYPTGTPDSFESTNSPTSQDLLVQNYRIWAAQPANPSEALTEVLRLKVRQRADGKPVVVDLRLIK